jgi:hypothetical protein
MPQAAALFYWGCEKCGLTKQTAEPVTELAVAGNELRPLTCVGRADRPVLD